MAENIYTIDATNKAVGRLATEIAIILRGKNKPTFAPNMESDNVVVVKNINFLKFTGKKLQQKVYKHHTNYPGHLKSIKMSDIQKENPAKVLEMAVLRMLPAVKFRKKMMQKLRFE
ncbi:MAG TPA: 50S ribosomal protein L13 [bacterium]|nr:50S ribosomal protein L13 [bacterium]